MKDRRAVSTCHPNGVFFIQILSRYGAVSEVLESNGRVEPVTIHRRVGVERRERLGSMMLAVAMALSASLVTGCAVDFVPPVLWPGVTVEAAPVVVEAPVVAGGVAIDVEPPPDERVYVYDAGFPPGVYLDGGFYWYGGFRYPQDVFINGYVATNLRGGLYANVAENRRAGVAIEAQHRATFTKTGGKRAPAAAHAQAAARPQQAARPAAPRASGAKRK
jgi:hypothetical protein